MKRLYSVLVEWKMSGRVHVVADNAEDAIEFVKDIAQQVPLPTDASYVEDSFEVIDDVDLVHEEL